jgi:hypothetical protein
MTDAIGTQKVAEPSSVVQADLATGELHLDTRILRFEGRDQFFLPDGQVVVAPAFDRQRHVFRMRQPGGAEDTGGKQQAFQSRAGHYVLPFIMRRSGAVLEPLN